MTEFLNNEFLQPIIEKVGSINMIYWDSSEIDYVIFRKDKLMTSDKKELKVGMKGFFSDQDEPQPFIIVSIDEKGIGLIFPYVYVVKKINNTVELKIGCDVFGEYENLFTHSVTKGKINKTIDYDYCNHLNVLKPSDKYTVHYFRSATFSYGKSNASIIKRSEVITRTASLFERSKNYDCGPQMCVNSFGNYGLPFASEPIRYHRMFGGGNGNDDNYVIWQYRIDGEKYNQSKVTN